MKIIERNEERLVLSIEGSESELEEVTEHYGDDWEADEAAWDLLEDLFKETDLSWLDASDTGDLTDAPLIGSYGDPRTEKGGPFGCSDVGFWDGSRWYSPIIERWGYMDYQVRSTMRDLKENGKVIFVSK